MTRKDRMLEAFDKLAVAEMHDAASFGRSEKATAAVTRSVVPVPVQRPSRRVWDWVIGAGTIGLVFLAARR